MKDFRYTTEHTDNNMVIVKIYKKGSRKVQYTMSLSDCGDWNVIEDRINNFIEYISKNH